MGPHDQGAPGTGAGPRTRRPLRSALHYALACLVIALVAGLLAGPDSTPRRDSGALSLTGGPGRAVPPSSTGVPPAEAVDPLSRVRSTSATAPETREGRRPNIVMVMADDMRVDDLRYAPTISRELGAGGITFDNSFSPFPLCCPARASFLSGRYAHNHRVMWHYAPYGFGSFDDSRSIGTSLSAAGYRTAYVGKYLNGYGLQPSRVTGRSSLHYVPAGWSDWYASIDGGPRTKIHGSTYNFFDVPFNVNGRIDNSHRGEYGTDVIGRFARRLIQGYAGSEQPFFLYTSFVAPHHGGPKESDDPKPVRGTDGKVRRFRTTARPAWVKGRFDRVIKRAPGLPKDGGPAERDVSDKPSIFRALPEPNRAERRALLEVTRQRAEAVYVLDRQVGKIIDTLKATGAWDDTVLMFTSDNGYFLGEHRKRDGKVLAHEPSLRVPFLVTGPGLRTGERRADPISTVDISATILDIAGASAPFPADGISRWPAITGGDRGWTTPIVTEAHKSIGGRRIADGFASGDPRSSIGLRTPRYSFTRYQNGEGELYDVLADPAQMRNRYRDPAYADVRAELTRLWFETKDCVGTACARELPPDLRASPAQARAMVDVYWAGVRAVYGP